MKKFYIVRGTVRYGIINTQSWSSFVFQSKKKATEFVKNLEELRKSILTNINPDILWTYSNREEILQYIRNGIELMRTVDPNFPNEPNKYYHFNSFLNVEYSIERVNYRG